MNAGGHIAVVARALASRRDPIGAARLLGSALPDLAAIGRFRLLGSTTDTAVTEGIALHHRTDELFHRHDWFRDRNRALTDELTGAGVRRGPAMACSHVGIELLLDGRLFQEPSIATANAEAFDAIADLRSKLTDLVAAPHRDRWLDHLDRLSTHRLPSDYHNPDAVAQRLYRILSARPRLALAENRIGVVAAALAERQPAIDASALPLVDDLAASLAAKVSDTSPQ